MTYILKGPKLLLKSFDTNLNSSLGSFVWVVDLGCDAIYHYKMSDSGLTKMSVTHVGDGRGPRHMKIIPERSLAVVACELENFVQVTLGHHSHAHIVYEFKLIINKTKIFNRCDYFKSFEKF